VVIVRAYAAGSRWSLIMAVVSVVVLVGCGGRPTAPVQRTLGLSACTVSGLQARCGTLAVPENPALPSGRQIDLKIVVLPATGTRVTSDAVFYLEGGPGGAATDAVANVAATLGTAREHRDIVFVDQRGTGASHPITCPAAAPERKPGLSDAQYAELAVRACLSKVDGDPRFYTTPYAVDDFDAVRVALGYDQLDLYGGSYGATSGQVFLARHGDRVRIAVFGGASLVDVPMLQTWARHAQEAFDKVVARCTADARCAGRYPHLAADLAALQRQVARHAVKTKTSGQPVTITPDSLATTVQLMTKSSEAARMLPLALHTAAVHGDFSTLAAEQVALAGPESPVQQVMPVMVACTEPWARVNPAAEARDSRGSYLAEAYQHTDLAIRVACRYLPRADVGPETVSSAVPVLFVQGGSDPQDPPENVADASRHFPNSTTVTVPWAGHGWVWDSCLIDLVNDTVVRGAVNADRTACVARATPPDFDLSG
jgi:pimeloyl-ACP methyl ester carboxylesterase